jgi:MoaA/NifB/PqqE/SkfB family radical SAM enzyme
VWEITLACNLACSHCGSRAGQARPRELTTAEALSVVAQMAAIGISEVSLIGGEAFLRRDWLTARAIVDAGMQCTLATGGYGVSLDTAGRMVEAGPSHGVH